jgi:hypothetical protein
MALVGGKKEVQLLSESPPGRLAPIFVHGLKDGVLFSCVFYLYSSSIISLDDHIEDPLPIVSDPL